VSILTRNKKVAVGVGIAAAAAAAIALGTGTYAAFTATAVGPSGTLAAGTMVLQVNGGNGTANLFDTVGDFPNGMYPGQTFTKDVTFKNISDVPATLSGSEVLTGISGGPDGNEHLRDEMQQSSHCTSSTSAINAGPALLRDVNGGVVGAGFTIPRNETGTCTFTFTLPATADNAVQGDAIKVDSTFTLTQNT
jgi:spore coat-associated protein N